MSPSGPRASESRLGPGSRLGPYEILGPLGSGGMGEVYRARDSRLARDVAVKVLPADSSADPDRLRRFEQESKAAGALNHPNVLAVFDAGVHEGGPYIVFELLQGETLRQRLEPGPLPTRKAVDYAVQIANGLAAAHQAAIVHRDLKPENLFVTADGRVKILDFGLAKLRAARDPGHALTDAATASEITGEGVVLGTAGYMSPEQVEGKPADHRSDIFSFGSVFYEMLSGRRAFRRDSSIETLRAILKEDPPELASAHGNVPPALERIVRRCLEKQPEERFSSARDIGFALEAVSTSSGAGATPGDTSERPRHRFILRSIAAALVAGVAVAAFFLGHEVAKDPPPSFHRLTFRRGANSRARFTPDGRTVVYGALWDAQPKRVFTTRLDSPESQPMDLPDGTDILAISSQGEMAILQSPLGPSDPCGFNGTLARVSLAGGAPRQVLEDVLAADWSPDGKELAVVHQVGERARLEFPVGSVLYEAPNIWEPRVSPRGDLVAFMDHAGVQVVDRSGKKKSLASWQTGWSGGLAWSPNGDEVWFPYSEAGFQLSLHAVSLSGQRRLVASFPAYAAMQDVSRDGRVLLTLADIRNGFVVASGDTRERDLSWLNYSSLAAISADGKMVLFSEYAQVRGAFDTVYVRKTDGSPPVRLGEGFARALSSDSKWAVALHLSPSIAPADDSSRPELVLLPTGPGEPKVISGQGIQYVGASFFPDGKRILVTGHQPGRPWRAYVQDIEGRPPHPMTPEGVLPQAISPDGGLVVAKDATGKLLLYSPDGGEPRAVAGPSEPGDIVTWSADGRSLFTGEHQGPVVKVFRRDLKTGRREFWKDLGPSDPTGVCHVSPIITPDGKSYAYAYGRFLSNLFLVEGLK